MTTAFEKTAGGAIFMDGNVVAEKIQTNIANTLSKNPNAKITLATVLIGDDPASKLYVGMKKNAQQLLASIPSM